MGRITSSAGMSTRSVYFADFAVAGLLLGEAEALEELPVELVEAGAAEAVAVDAAAPAVAVAGVEGVEELEVETAVSLLADCL